MTESYEPTEPASRGRKNARRIDCPDPQAPLTSEELEAAAQERASLEAGLTLLWEGEPEASRGPKRRLRLEHIVATAVDIADREGLDGLSMRRLARALGVGTMSLYRYVSDKSVLLSLMIDRVFADEKQYVDPGGGWREVLRARVRADREVYRLHPWLVSINWNRPVIGPHMVGAMEFLVAGMEELPFTDREKMALFSALDGYVLGVVRQEIQSSIAAQDAGLTDQEFWETQVPFLEGAMASGKYPVMAQMDEDTWDGDWEESFEMGLSCMIDGIACRAEARTRGESAP